MVQQRRPDATLTLVGGGAEEPSLRALVEELGLKHVTFAGRVRPDEIAAFYHDHDIYLQSPNIDNMPTSVIEAYACGLPVVSTDAGGVPAILTHGVHGLLAPVGDHERLGAHVLQLLDRPDVAAALTRAAAATCQACTWSAVRSQWLGAYSSVLPARGREQRSPFERSAAGADLSVDGSR